MNAKVEELLQKYLSGKTDRDEEKKLLDICLKDINDLRQKLPAKLQTINLVLRGAS